MANLRFTSARQVFESNSSVRKDVSAPPTDEPPLDYLTKLASSESPEDAISFCAYLLDRREAVWWASQSTRMLGSPISREEEVALLTAEAWVRDPEEHRRKAALDMAVSGNHDLAGIWVAMAAGGAGGTMAFGDMQSGPPVPPDMTAKSARGAVLIALATKPSRERSKYIGQVADLCRKLVLREQA